MMCLRNFLLFLIILPFPAASPLFMFTFITAMWLKLRPCVYCSLVLVVFFFAISTPSYLSLSFPEDPYRPLSARPFIVDENSTILEQAFAGNQTTFLYSAPTANRSWVDLNYGRLLWPKLEGYRLLDTRPGEKKGNPSMTATHAIKAMIEEKNPHASRTEREEPIDEATPLDASMSGRIQVKTTLRPRRGWFDWSKTSFLEEKGTVEMPEPATRAYVADPEPLPEPVSTDYYPTDYTDNHLESSYNVDRDGDGDDDGQTPIIRLPWYAYIMHPSQLPLRYDLRLNGVGFVLDLGMGRGEQAVKREVREWKAWEAGKKRRRTVKEIEARREVRTGQGKAGSGMREEL